MQFKFRPCLVSEYELVKGIALQSLNVFCTFKYMSWQQVIVLENSTSNVIHCAVLAYSCLGNMQDNSYAKSYAVRSLLIFIQS